MLQRIDELLKKKADFAIETMLATRSYAQTIKKAKSQGYNITLVYFWLNSPELAIARVTLHLIKNLVLPSFTTIFNLLCNKHKVQAPYSATPYSQPVQEVVLHAMYEKNLQE